MLRPNMERPGGLSGSGAPAKPRPAVPLVIYTAFDAQKAEELAKRIENAPPRVNVSTPPVPSTPMVSLPAVIFTAFDADKAEELRGRIKNKRASEDQPTQAEAAAVSSSPIASEPSLPDISPDSEEPEISASDSESLWSSEQPHLGMNAAELSYYTTAQQDEFVKEVAISLQHEKLILAYLENPIEYLKSFPRYGWDEESDKAAEEFIQWYVDRFRPELERQRDIDWLGGVESDIEYWIRDVANDERESVIVYDLDADEILFIRFGDKDSVTMQKLHQKLAEGRNIVVIHNHPKNTGASLADLDAAAWLDAELMYIVNPDGTLHRYALEGDEMVALEPLHNPDYVAAADPVETAAADLAYLLQSLREIGNPPEMVMRQGETAPKLSDYINHPQSRQTYRPRIDRDYAQYIPMPAPTSPHFAKFYYTSMNYYLLQSLAISGFASISGASGFDMAGKMLNHHLKTSGETYEIPVDDMLADLPGIRRSVIEAVGFGLGELFAPSNAEDGGSEDMVLQEIGDHTVYAFPLDWREVGIGTEDDIYGFSGDMSASPEAIVKLLQGIPLDENATQEAYDWYVALGKFYYYPRVTVVVDNNTGNAEVGLVIDVQDHYNWHADAGPLDWIMAELETKGYGKNFRVYGRSSPIIGSFNLNDVTMKNEEPYYQLKINEWDEHK